MSRIRFGTLLRLQVHEIAPQHLGNDMQRLRYLTDEVSRALRDVVELTGKLIGKPSSLPADLPDLPRELSFWIGSHLGGPVADHQQALLEITDTGERLRQEYELLDQTRRQLAARTVLKDTLAGSDPRGRGLEELDGE